MFTNGRSIGFSLLLRITEVAWITTVHLVLHDNGSSGVILICAIVPPWSLVRKLHAA